MAAADGPHGPAAAAEVPDGPGEVDEKLVPLAQAIGQAVLGAAGLEKLLLVDVAQRSAKRSGLTDELRDELTRLERRPAGELLRLLRELGIAPDLAEQLKDVIDRRNELVHRFLERPDVFRAFASGQGIDEVVESVRGLSGDIECIVNEIAPGAFGGAEKALGASLSQMLALLGEADPSAVEEEQTRRHIEMARLVDPSTLDLEPAEAAPRRTRPP